MKIEDKIRAIDILEKNGFDFEKFKDENEYSATNLLSAMEEYASFPTTTDDEIKEAFFRYSIEIEDFFGDTVRTIPIGLFIKFARENKIILNP